MGMTAWKRAGVSLTAVAVIAGVAGCQDGDGGKKAAPAPAKATAEPQLQSHEAVTKVIQAAYKKTSAAKSAKIRMTITMPAAMDGGGTMEMTGVQGWDPAAMDITMKGSLMTVGDPDAPEQMRMIMLGDAMYMDVGAERAAELDGKRWMKVGLKGQKGQEDLTGGLQSSMNQDPAQQLALLLESPNLKHIGAEKINGVQAQHYKGTLSFEQMLDANKAKSATLSKEEREKLIANVGKIGLKGYDTDVWVDAAGYPVRMVVGMTTAVGTVHMKGDYTDYGPKATVEAPPAKDTYDLSEMLKGLDQS
ncbi:hypothetical protein [Streptomyces sp. NBC_01353]|uniref:hypothetical protein n=1 Tax=Streptomyces sp. NBC_01353 TaxID=2903835 RepID=UPI002E333413|nr:hypothetical protein [Streptomyces sp. NBC_01353]